MPVCQVGSFQKNISSYHILSSCTFGVQDCNRSFVKVKEIFRVQSLAPGSWIFVIEAETEGKNKESLGW